MCMITCIWLFILEKNLGKLLVRCSPTWQIFEATIELIVSKHHNINAHRFSSYNTVTHETNSNYKNENSHFGRSELAYSLAISYNCFASHRSSLALLHIFQNSIKQRTVQAYASVSSFFLITSDIFFARRKC